MTPIRADDEINEFKKAALQKIEALNFLNMQVRSNIERYILTV